MTSSLETAPRPGRMADVTATISGDRLPPEFWTNYFGIVPTFHVKKGSTFITSSGKRSAGIGKSNIWGYSTKNIITDDVLNPHLNYLVSKLELPRPNFKARLDADQLSFHFTCFWVNFTHDRVSIIEPHLEEIINKSGGIVLIDDYS